MKQGANVITEADVDNIVNNGKQCINKILSPVIIDLICFQYGVNRDTLNIHHKIKINEMKHNARVLVDVGGFFVGGITKLGLSLNKGIKE